jgi:hypothetical protein
VTDDEVMKRIELILKASAQGIISPALATQWVVPLFKSLLEKPPGGPIHRAG